MEQPTSRSDRHSDPSGRDDGHPSISDGQEYGRIELAQDDDGSHQHDELTSTSTSSTAKTQGASITPSNPSFYDSGALHFDSLHHDSQHPHFPGFSHHSNSNDAFVNPPWSQTKSQAEVNFGRLYGSHPSVGQHTSLPQPIPRPFYQPDTVYIRFTHIVNLQPKFYLGSAMHSTLVREYSRSRKFLQLNNERLVQAELALRYWQEHDNLYIWAPIPIYTNRSDFRCLELALIQEWQPRLNFPFICQFFHPKRGLLKKPLLNTNSQFGLATLWRRSRHKFTPELVRKILSSSRFQNRLELWTIIHALGSNTKARFEHIKLLRSNDGGLTMCYALRRLANNIQEPFRTLSLSAIDATIKWWKGKPAPRASALRAPWSLSPDLPRQLKQFLRSWHHKMVEYQVPCHLPSFKTVFIKHSAVLDQLCNHKQAINDWSTTNSPICCCKDWSKYKTAALNPQDDHWVLSGSLLHSLLPSSLAVIAEGSLSNKVFPSKKDYLNQLHHGLRQWTKRNSLPSMPVKDITEFGHHLWQEHSQHITHHITKSSITQLQSTFEGAVFHCEDKQASSLRLYCPCLYYQAISNTFQDPSIFETVDIDPTTTVD